MQISQDEEAWIVNAILGNLDPDEHAGYADAIFHSLIETGLLDTHLAPAALRAWLTQPDGEIASADIDAIYGVR